MSMPQRRSQRPRQLDLRLPTWGGARPGAGRKPTGDRPGVAHATRPRLAARFPVHVTLRVRPHVYQLRSRRCFRVLGAAFLAARERHGVRLCHYSVQGNHVHLIVEARDAAALGRAMKGLGVRLARGLNRLMGTRGPVLADRYHARILRSPRQVRNALAYVLGNHRHHAGQWAPAPRGLEAAPRGEPRRGDAWANLDPYASGRAFDGWRRPPRPPAPPRPGRDAPGCGPSAIPVAPPHTWLLATGWRRHGLLDAG
jgi:putative transposase